MPFGLRHKNSVKWYSIYFRDFRYPLSVVNLNALF